MKEKRIEDLSEQEFRGILDYMASEEFDRMTVAEFFGVLAEMEEEEPCKTLEMKATVKGGQLTFLEPAPLHAHGNEIRLGEVRLVIKLVPEEVSLPVPQIAAATQEVDNWVAYILIGGR